MKGLIKIVINWYMLYVFPVFNRIRKIRLKFINNYKLITILTSWKLKCTPPKCLFMTNFSFNYSSILMMIKNGNYGIKNWKQMKSTKFTNNLHNIRIYSKWYKNYTKLHYLFTIIYIWERKNTLHTPQRSHTGK